VLISFSHGYSATLAAKLIIKLDLKGQIPKKGLQVRTRGLSMFGEVELKNTFLFREPECDPVVELMISRQKIDYWLPFLVMEVR